MRQVNYDHLLDAIADGNVDFFRQHFITGNPIQIDINNLPPVPVGHRHCDFYNQNLFVFLLATCKSAASVFDIITHILAYRDANGNPYINLNAERSVFGWSLLTCIIRRSNPYYLRRGIEKFSLEQVRQLTDRVINCRNNRGEQLFTRYHDNSEGGGTSALIEAIRLNDIACVQLLLDLRNADGEYAIDPNRIYADDPSPLSIALHGDIVCNYAIESRGQSSRNPHIIAMLQARGAIENPVRQVVVGPPVNNAMPLVNNAPATQRQPTARNARSNIAIFNRNSQNTHTPEVERTIDLSIAQLKETYKDAADNLNFSDVTREIDSLITAHKNSKHYTADKISDIRRGFSHVCMNSMALHAPSGLHLSAILKLVWMAIHDESKMPEDFPASSDKKAYVEIREIALLDKFLDIATTYPGGGTACLGGTRNLIVSALNKAHPDVNIVTIADEINPVAFALAKQCMLANFKRQSNKEQRGILRTWSDDSQEDNKTIAHVFKESMLPAIISDLHSKLPGIIPEKFFTDLKNTYEYFPMPIAHPQLLQLLVNIEALPDDSEENAVVKKAAADVFADSDDLIDFELSYQLVLRCYEEMQSISRLEKKRPQLLQLIFEIEKYCVEKFAEGNQQKSNGSFKLLSLLKSVHSNTRNFDALQYASEQIDIELGVKGNSYFSAPFFRKSDLKNYYQRASILLAEIIDKPISSQSTHFCC